MADHFQLAGRPVRESHRVHVETHHAARVHATRAHLASLCHWSFLQTENPTTDDGKLKTRGPARLACPVVCRWVFRSPRRFLTSTSPACRIPAPRQIPDRSIVARSPD